FRLAQQLHARPEDRPRRPTRQHRRRHQSVAAAEETGPCGRLRFAAELTFLTGFTGSTGFPYLMIYPVNPVKYYSSSSMCFGRSSPNNRDITRSARIFPPV